MILQLFKRASVQLLPFAELFITFSSSFRGTNALFWPLRAEHSNTLKMKINKKKIKTASGVEEANFDMVFNCYIIKQYKNYKYSMSSEKMTVLK